ncbi:MAG: M14-type cytosolic carboxypeptidase [Melioribacteraceae bacterium]
MKNTLLFLLLLTTLLTAQITLDADFESGNLLSIDQIDSVSFNVTTKEDIGGRWFYFRMSGVKDKEVRIRITNSDVKRAMYSYDNEIFERFTSEESSTNVFIKQYTQDTVYVSYYTPYTFSYLQKRLIEWTQNEHVTLDTIGFTNKLLPIQEMIITDRSIPNSEKQTVWIHARTHPSETPSSWHFDGIVQELLSGKEEINFYLERIEFHLIPFTNPDGVFYGRSRTNFDGIDVESNWDKSEATTTKEVKILRARMKELNDEKPFSVFLNLHSQVSSFCTFWVHTEGTTSQSFYQKEHLFAFLNISDNQYFEKDDLRFSTLKSKFPEGWLWNNYGSQVMALTYETPYDNYLRNSSDLFVTNENLFELGSRTVYSIAEYLEISHPKHYIMDNSIANISGTNSTSTTGLEFFGGDFIELDPNDTDASAIFISEELHKGKYDVAGWWSSSDDNSFETKFEIITTTNSYEETKTQKLNGGQWNYLTTIELTNNGTIQIKLKSNSTGKVVADAFRLNYVGAITSVEDENIPSEFILYQNYPNPFNPTTTIKFTIPEVNTNLASITNTTLRIYDVLGKEVVTLVDKNKSTGTYEVIFNASNLASGTYIYRLQVGSLIETKKMLLIK